MVQITGAVHDVSDSPDVVERILVRAVTPRLDGSTYISTEPASFRVENGVLEFNALPGPCVVTFIRRYGSTTFERLLVPNAETATFQECLNAANLADEGTTSALEEVVRQIQEELGKAAPLVEEVRALRSDVEVVAAEVSGAVHRTETAEGNAKLSEQKAAASAESIQGVVEDVQAYTAGAEQAKDAAEGFKQAAEKSANAAKVSEVNSESHVVRAEQARDAAGEYAELLEPEKLQSQIAARLEEIVDGAPGDLDTLREIAEYAQENRGITDQLNSAIGNKADKGHTHAVADVTGLEQTLAGKANVSHSHTVSDIDGLETSLTDKADTVHTHSVSDVAGLEEALEGKAKQAHNHSMADVEGLSAQLQGLQDLVKSRPAFFSGEGSPTEVPNASVGDYWLDESTMELYRITEV